MKVSLLNDTPCFFISPTTSRQPVRTSHRLKPWQQTDQFAFLQIGSSIGEIFYRADEFPHESQTSMSHWLFKYFTFSDVSALNFL